MKLSGWGRYPTCDARLWQPTQRAAVPRLLARQDAPLEQVIPRGMGRSYGDPALAKEVISCTGINRIISFDAETGLLEAEAGVTLDDITTLLVPRGWFLPVTPGTRFVSLGGAVASDVHGKNHHHTGSFAEHLDWIELVLPSGEIRICSREEHADLFAATCGGMGLTGYITRIALRLMRIETAYMRQRNIKTANLSETMDALEDGEDWPYSVAWLDCLASGDKLGRGHVTLARHATLDDLELAPHRLRPLELAAGRELGMPITAPPGMLNGLSLRSFNAVYYNRQWDKVKDGIVDYRSYFYPLDAIANWNRMYGPSGFVQYQCVLPLAASRDGMTDLLRRISTAGTGSFLAVLKKLGPQGLGWLSFPMEGYTLALDFPRSRRLHRLLDDLDAITLAAGGRLYLAKDSCMTAEMFRAGYPDIDRFKALKAQIDPHNTLSSLQSQRLGLT